LLYGDFRECIEGERYLGGERVRCFLLRGGVDGDLKNIKICFLLLSVNFIKFQFLLTLIFFFSHDTCDY
jgi:hypothetical protein